jgi:hypothetical protein
MDEGLVTAVLEPLLEASDVAGGEVEQSSGLGLAAFPVEHAVQDFEDIAFLLTHGNPVFGKHVDRHGSSFAWARRTFLSR